MATQDTTNRIFIAVDASRQGLAILERAAALAARRQAELVTLFIEDINLINLAGLPFAREIDLASAAERRLDDMQMARALRTQAQQVSRMLDRLAAQMKVSYSFRVVRGSYMTEVLSASENTDVLFLSRRTGRYRMYMEEQPAARQPLPVPDVRNAIYVVYDGSADAERALTLANDLALIEEGKLVVLLSCTSAAESARLLQQADAVIDAGVAVHYVDISSIDDPALCRALRRKESLMLILPRHATLRAEHLADTLLEEAGCPVVLV